MPLTDDQFVQLLEGFADLDIFNGRDTPVIFVVYAHNNKIGEAKADVVHLLIKWLKTIRARAISDKSPLLSSVEYTGSAPAGNILDNQFRLIPASGSDQVRKVILCGSEELQRYCADPFTDNYVKGIKGLYQGLYRRKDGLRRFQDSVREAVQEDSGKPGFHHILTELAFLQIRKEADHTHHGIIPVVLTGDDIRQYLPFIKACDVFLKNQDHDPRKMFFKLLGQIFIHPGDSIVIDEINECYTNLQKRNETSDNDVKIQVHNSIFKMAQNRIAAWRAHGSSHIITTTRHFMVPFGRNENFVGRENILEQLLERIPPAANKDNCQHTAIEGLGGIGKTQIALEAAYRFRDEHPDCSVFWVPAVNLTSFENAYREIGRLLNCQGINNDKADVKLLVKDALSQENSSSWLLIIDNADDIDMLFQDANLDNYLPFSWHGSILFTTRNHQITEQLDIPLDNIINVGEMNNTETADLLQRGLRKSQIGDAKSTDRLLEYLAHLPLAVKQASAFMALNTNVTVAKYLEFCESSDASMIELLSRQFNDRHRYKDNAKNQNPVAMTWLISFKHISQHSPQAADYLKFICILAEKDIPLSLLPVTSEIEIAEAVGALYAYAFILERNTPDSFNIHRLVRLIMRNWLQQNGEWKEWTAKVVERLDKKYPFPDHENIQTWTKYLPHGQAVLSDGAIDIGDIELLVRIAESYSFLGKYSEAEKLYRRTLEQTENKPGGDYHTAVILNNLAVAISGQGGYKAAEEIYRQTLDLREELGKKHAGTLITMDNLAGSLGNQGRYKEAEEIYQQTLDLKEEVLGEKHPNTLSTMNNLALVFSKQGRYKEAEEIYQQTLSVKEEVLGRKHPDTLITINNLAYNLFWQDRYEEAEEMCRQTLQLREEVLGTEHPDTLNTAKLLADILRTREKLQSSGRSGLANKGASIYVCFEKGYFFKVKIGHLFAFALSVTHDFKVSYFLQFLGDFTYRSFSSLGCAYIFLFLQFIRGWSSNYIYT